MLLVETWSSVTATLKAACVHSGDTGDSTRTRQSLTHGFTFEGVIVQNCLAVLFLGKGRSHGFTSSVYDPSEPCAVFFLKSLWRQMASLLSDCCTRKC